MIINKVTFHRFRSFEYVDVECTAMRTLILARNGVGKTSLIEGIAAALGGFTRVALGARPKKIPQLFAETDHRRVWRAATLEASVEDSLVVEANASWNGVDFSWQCHSMRPKTSPTATEGRVEWTSGQDQVIDTIKAASTSLTPPLPLLAGLRAQRSFRGDKTPLPPPRAEDSVSPERLVRFAAGIFVDTQWYPLRDRWYELEVRRQLSGKRAEATYQTVVAALTRALHLETPPAFHPDDQDVVMDIPGEGLRAVGLMSDGWRSYVSTIVALALRCSELNPTNPNAAADTPGVLLIDEIEQHLHPALQLRILDGLSRAFPLLQIIATTHSPLVLTDVPGDGAPEERRGQILHLDRVEEDGALCVELLSETTGRDVLQVLTGSWFGLPSTLDDGTLELLAKHRELLRKGPSVLEERKQIEAEIRERRRRYADTSVEELVISVVAELEQDKRFEKLSHAEMKELRQEVIDRIKAQLS